MTYLTRVVVAWLYIYVRNSLSCALKICAFHYMEIIPKSLKNIYCYQVGIIFPVPQPHMLTLEEVQQTAWDIAPGLPVWHSDGGA